MTAGRRNEISEIAMMRAQIKELQDAVEMLCATAGFSRKLLIADGITLLSTKQAMLVTGLSRSGVQKLINTKRVDAQWCGGRWYIDPTTLPRF